MKSILMKTIDSKVSEMNGWEKSKRLNDFQKTKAFMSLNVLRSVEADIVTCDDKRTFFLSNTKVLFGHM